MSQLDRPTCDQSPDCPWATVLPAETARRAFGLRVHSARVLFCSSLSYVLYLELACLQRSVIAIECLSCPGAPCLT
jgi:hypothetical protein